MRPSGSGGSAPRLRSRRRPVSRPGRGPIGSGEAKAPLPTPMVERTPTDVEIVNKAINPGASDPNVPLPQANLSDGAGNEPHGQHRAADITAAARMAAACLGPANPHSGRSNAAGATQDSVRKPPQDVVPDKPGPELGQEMRGAKTALLPLSHRALESPLIGRLPCTSLIVVCILPSGVGAHPAPPTLVSFLNKRGEELMKKALMAAAALVALPVMAQAQAPSPGVYIGAEGGVNWLLNFTPTRTFRRFRR